MLIEGGNAMRKMISIFCLLLLSFSGRAEAELRPQGSVNLLDGRTFLVTVFLNDTDAQWTREDKAYVRSAMRIAEEYLTNQAARYGADTELFFDELFVDVTFEGLIKAAEGETEDFADTLRALLHKELSIDELTKKYETDSYGFVFLLPAVGGAYALPYEEECKVGYEELCVIYLYDDQCKGQRQPAPVFAHEILHTFGAIDLYQACPSDGVTEELVEYITEYYPTELMITVYEEDASTSETGVSQMLSDVTLYSIGLIEEPDVVRQFPLLYREDVASFHDKTELYEQQTAA